MRGTGVLLLLHFALSRKTSNSCTDIKNQPCIFPFKFDGREFHRCTRHNTLTVGGKAWCASEVDKDGEAQCHKRGKCEVCSSSNNSSSNCFPDVQPDVQPTCQNDDKSLDAKIICLNENGDIPCQVDDDCPEDYIEGQAKSFFSYTCYKEYDYGRCVENENEKQCNKDSLRTDPFCMR